MSLRDAYGTSHRPAAFPAERRLPSTNPAQFLSATRCRVEEKMRLQAQWPSKPGLRITLGKAASHLDRRIYFDLRNGFVAASGVTGRNLRRRAVELYPKNVQRDESLDIHQSRVRVNMR